MDITPAQARRLRAVAVGRALAAEDKTDGALWGNVAKAMATKKRKASGVNIPNSQRHTVQVLLRVPPNVLEELDELAEKWGVTRSGVVGLLLDQRAARRATQAARATQTGGKDGA